MKIRETKLLSILLLSIFCFSCSSSTRRIIPHVDFQSARVEKKIDFQIESPPFSMFANVQLEKLLVKRSFNLVLSFLDMENYRIDIFSPGIPRLLYVITRRENINNLYSIAEKVKYSSSKDLLSFSGLGIEAKYILSVLGNVLPSNIDLSSAQRTEQFYKVSFNLNSKQTDYYFERCSANQIRIHGLEVFNVKNKVVLSAKGNYPSNNCKRGLGETIELRDLQNSILAKIENLKFKDLKIESLDFQIDNFKTIRIN